MAQNGDLPPSKRILKIYPSSSAFMLGPVVKTGKHGSCLRYLGAQVHSGLSSAELRQDIPAEYAALGALDEYRYAVKLERAKVQFQREVPFKVEFKGVTISGRMDFVLDNGVIIEKKSTTSESVYKRVFQEGQPEIAHVAQLASYLAFLNKSEGRIVITYYELELDGEEESFRAVEEREFIVKSLDSGALTIDGAPYPHSLRDLARWYAETEKNLSSPWAPETGLPQKPYQGSSYRESPCNFCPLKKVCAETTDVAQFVLQAKEALLVKEAPRPFKIKVLTARRKFNKEKKENAKQ